jgi:hypothetical protein
MGHTKIGGCESWKRVGWKWEGLRECPHASEEGEECEEHGDMEETVGMKRKELIWTLNI